MTGQISIRLPSSMIAQLNRMAKETGQKRAEILRQMIALGIEQSTKKHDPILAQIEDLKSEVLDVLKSIPQQLRDGGHATEKPGDVNHRRQPVEKPDVLTADDSADENATTILAGETPKNKRRENDIQSDRTEDSSSPATKKDDSIGARLNRARLSLGLSIAQVGQELNIDPVITRDVLENGRRVPASRAIRVEAKLQQWESRLTAQDT